MPSIFAQQALTAQGWRKDVRITFEGGAITAIAADSAAIAGDERLGILLPAIANLHSHAFQRAMAGLAERRGPQADSFWTWRDTMYRHALTMTPDQMEVVACLAFMEMVETGFGRVGEFHYLHHAQDGQPYDDPAELAVRIVAAAKATGIALTLLPVFYAHGGFGGAAPSDHQRRFLNGLDRFGLLVESARKAASASHRTDIGIAPHSLRAVTPDELATVASLAGTAPIHIHIAEQMKEVEDCIAWSGARPVEWLLANADVGPNWCLIHATHMNEDETAGLARSGAVAGLCPVTEANLGDGIFNGQAFAAQNGIWGVGTDSNVMIGLADELRQLEYSQRLALRARNVMAHAAGSTGRALFDAALKGGHAALGQPDGAIAIGGPADFFSLHCDHPNLTGRQEDAALDAFVFAGAGPIETAWLSGRKLVENGRHVARDAIEPHYRQVLAELAHRCIEF